MNDYDFGRRHIPVFGSWDWDNETPLTQCFESARQAGLFQDTYAQDRDLYVAGDLYENDVVTPAVIVVPRRLTGKVGYTKEKDCDCELKAPPPCPVSAALSVPTYIYPPNAVNEDLYKISPDLVQAKKRRKRKWGFFSSCLRLDCLS